MRTRVNKDGNIDKAERIVAHLKPERLAGIDRNRRIVFGQRQHLQRHLNFILLALGELGAKPRVKRLVCVAGLGPIAEAKVVFGERHAEQLFASGISARNHLIHERLEKPD